MIAQALRGDLSDWRGLGDESFEELTEALGPVVAVVGPRYAERGPGRFDKYAITRPEEPTEVEVWVTTGESAPALIEFDDPPATDVDALLDGLGEPEEVQHNRRFRSGALVDELVYASHGLSLSVATPHADVGVIPTPRGSRRIIHVQLFRATTVDQWRANIGSVVPLRPFPLR